MCSSSWQLTLIKAGSMRLSRGPRCAKCDAMTSGLLRGWRQGGFIVVRMELHYRYVVCASWARDVYGAGAHVTSLECAAFRATRRLAIAENIYKSQQESSLGLFAVCAWTPYSCAQQ